jgi:hypothetical protein
MYAHTFHFIVHVKWKQIEAKRLKRFNTQNGFFPPKNKQIDYYVVSKENY